MAEALGAKGDEPEMHAFYHDLWVAEAKHGNIFVKMALVYFPEDKVYERLQWWIDT